MSTSRSSTDVLHRKQREVIYIFMLLCCQKLNLKSVYFANLTSSSLCILVYICNRISSTDKVKVGLSNLEIANMHLLYLFQNLYLICNPYRLKKNTCRKCMWTFPIHGIIYLTFKWYRKKLVITYATHLFKLQHVDMNYNTYRKTKKINK